MADRQRDKPWVIRTYAGHSSAAESNALFRRNLAKGQTGLSIAFDLPTQTGYDPDSDLARGEVGKVGVPVSHLGDMRALFHDMPLAEMNTSMTINATAMWLLALYQVVAEEEGADITALQGTTQNDIVKEYLSRGTYAFPPAPSVRLTTDLIAYTVSNIPKWNPINISSYHLQEAGATPAQELAYSLCTAIAILDSVRDSGQVPQERFGDVVARISFFVNAGVRFIEETCKMRAFVRMWDEITSDRYGVADPKDRRFRYGVQVNSLGLTEAQPENNVIRIVLESLGVTLSKDARCRALQLPAWNEAYGLPRPWDQQWSLRIQQILAYETDLLEYDDIFDGSPVIERKVDELVAEARAEIDRVQGMGGAIAAVESGYMKSQLVASHAEHRARIEAGKDIVVGVNKFEATEPSPLLENLDAAIQTVDPAVEAAAIKRLNEWKAQRDTAAADAALVELRDAAKREVNLMPATLACARAGVTTGEWAAALREVFGEYRAPTGVASVAPKVAGEQVGGVARRRAADLRRAGPQAEVPAGQTRPGRALQRRRADRRAGARRRLRGGLPGHPAHAGADRGRRRRRGRPCRRLVDPVRVAYGADPGGAARAARGGAGGRPCRGRRDHPRRGRGRAEEGRRRRGLHAEGLCDQRHHGRDRRDRARRQRPAAGCCLRTPGGTAAARGVAAVRASREVGSGAVGGPLAAWPPGARRVA